MPRHADFSTGKDVEMPLLLALIIVPIIEIGLFVKVGGLIGLWPTLAIVIVTALIGSSLLRSQGAAAIRELQGSMGRGGDPGKALANGALILVSGILLLTPGFFTDAMGLALLAPPVRAAVIAWGVKRFKGAVHVGAMNAGAGGDPAGDPRRGARVGPMGGPMGGDVIEGEWEDVERDETRRRPPKPD
jgi:UPF0716 protein FxsA